MTSWKLNPQMRFVTDNGSHNLRFGVAGDPKSQLYTRNAQAIQKRTGNTYICEELERILDEPSYRYYKPHIKGVVVNFDIQMNIWNHLFLRHMEDKNAKGYSFTATLPYGIPQRCKEKLLEILFEFYCFSGFLPLKYLHNYYNLLAQLKL